MFMDTKQEKIKLLIREATRFMLDFRKKYHMPPVPPDTCARLSKHQFFGLRILAGHENMSMSELAEHTGVSKQQMTRIMDDLVKNGFAERFTPPPPGDRRSVQTVISDAGREILFKLEARHEAVAAGWFARLSEDDLDAILSHLRDLADILGKAGII
jgi:DNA-binding MarR family transcriptional regulator